MKTTFLNIFFLLLLINKNFSQISLPGLGKANMAGWFAFGIRQKLDTISGKGWQSMSYIGLGRKSNPDNYDPFYKSAILAINQEFYHQFHKDWQYSLALSYRRQDEYLNNKPYEHDNPKLKQEFRFYSRLSYTFSTSRIKLVSTFRQEFRKFYSSDLQNTNENFQSRTRLRLQLKINLANTKQHQLIASSEQLFSISKENTSGTWTDFNYRESRFSLYYSYSPKTLPFICSVGYMNNLVDKKNPYDAHYLAYDIVIENPFKLRERPKTI